ncbi:MAG: hypothetical protein ABSB69_04640 [Solirubrobacteraceae bacterium]
MVLSPADAREESGYEVQAVAQRRELDAAGGRSGTASSPPGAARRREAGVLGPEPGRSSGVACQRSVYRPSMPSNNSEAETLRPLLKDCTWEYD